MKKASLVLILFLHSLSAKHSKPPVRIQQPSKWTPLHEAARKCDNKEALKLLESGIDANTKNSLGDTPLHVTSSHEVAETLVKTPA